MTLNTLLRKPFRHEFWNAAFIIIGINLLVYLLTMIDPSLTRILSLNPLYVTRGGMVWQVFTYQFVHANLSHLVFNMLGVFFFGLSVERSVGSKEFVLFYLLCGTLSGMLSLAVYLVSGIDYVFLMGASGAVFSLLLAYATIYPRSVIYLWGIVPIPAPLLVLGYAGIEFFNLVTGMNQGVAHSTHLFGFAVAWIYFLVRFGTNPAKAWSGR